MPKAALILTLILCGCSASDLGHRSVVMEPIPTLPADCPERLARGEDCTVTVPKPAVANPTMPPVHFPQK